MEALATQRWQELRDWLVPERPCSLIAWYVLVTGIGRCWVDSLSQPRCVIAFAGGNLTLAGDAEALSPARFAAVIETLLEDWKRVFIAAPDAFVPAVCAARPWVAAELLSGLGARSPRGILYYTLRLV